MNHYLLLPLLFLFSSPLAGAFAQESSQSDALPAVATNSDLLQKFFNSVGQPLQKAEQSNDGLAFPFEKPSSDGLAFSFDTPAAAPNRSKADCLDAIDRGLMLDLFERRLKLGI